MKAKPRHKVEIALELIQRLAVLAVLFFTFVAPLQTVVAEPKGKSATESAYNRAKADYTRLKQVDPDVSELSSWEEAASKLINFLHQYPDSEYTPKCLIALGRLYETTYRVRKFGNGLSRAMYFYESLARDFPGHPLADDALLYLGDLRRSGAKDEAGAKAAYFEIVDKYSGSESYRSALSRLGMSASEAGSGASAASTSAASKSAAGDREDSSPKSSKTENRTAALKREQARVEQVEEEQRRTELAKQEKSKKDRGKSELSKAEPPQMDAEPTAIAGKPKQIPGEEPTSLTMSKELAQPKEPESKPEAAMPTPGLAKLIDSDRSGRDIYSSKFELKRPLIIIDPGHGGEDLGAAGPDGVLEKEVVLNIAKDLDEMLREQLRARTIMTRTTDVTVALAERTKLANDNKADLFISIHANASEKRNVSGIETYYLDNTNDKSSIKLAERENESIKFGRGKESDISFMLSDLIQNAKLDDSIRLSHNVQDAMVSTLSKYYQNVKNLGVKKAVFYVLVGAHMPCVLLEVSFIDHPVEGKRLVDRRYQLLVANAIYRGVRSYFEREP